MHLVEQIDKLSLDDIGRIEKLALRCIFQAAYDFGSKAHEIFRRSRDNVEDVAEDVTRELLDRLPGYNIPRRVFGTVDYKKYRSIILPELLVRQACLRTSRAAEGRTLEEPCDDPTEAGQRQFDFFREPARHGARQTHHPLP
jgi:hypothetical protein